jgi:hypothetical protein|tara:strand:+ start:952 stop:1125 length:174 start_codon:yes stop_codon:yes gene_type:complete
MEQTYNIDEILLAVDEINNKKKIKKIEKFNNKHEQKDYSAVPKDTLRLIEEAEKLKK